MLDLTFGEQVKIVLSRKGMTIKELAEIIEERTGKKMSRQNLTQRLGRDNFQEQDMRLIAEILGCPFQLSILADMNEVERASHIEDVKPTEKELSKLARAKERKEVRKEKRVEKDAKPVEKQEEKKEEKSGAKSLVQKYIVAGRNKKETVVSTREVTLEEKPMKKTTRPVEAPVHKEAAEEVVYEEPVYQEAVEEVVYEEPVYQEAAEEMVYEEAAAEEAYAEPVYEEVVVAEEDYQEPAYEEVVVEEAYEEPVQEEIVIEEIPYEEPAQEEPVYEEPVYETSEAEIELEVTEEVVQPEEAKQEEKKARGWRAMFQRRSKKEEIPNYESDYIDYETKEVPVEEEPVVEEVQEPVVGEVNPYTGQEYESNSVRVHPKRIGYVQVYDRDDHQWTDMTEWAFLGYQERMKALLGKDYEPPIYLD